MISVLFARADSNYKKIPGLDVWDKERDARNFPGGNPVIAHPPCRGWGRLRKFAKPEPGELYLGPFAAEQVRKWGGVLEHPASSTLWGHCGLPKPGEPPDKYGGFTIRIDQFHFGHRAEKATWLYVVGCTNLPPIPHRPGKPTCYVRPRKNGLGMTYITKAEREHTPQELAAWLVEVASRCVAR